MCKPEHVSVILAANSIGREVWRAIAASRSSSWDALRVGRLSVFDSSTVRTAQLATVLQPAGPHSCVCFVLRSHLRPVVCASASSMPLVLASMSDLACPAQISMP